MVDSQRAVRDALGAAFAALRLGYAHQIDDLKHHVVPQPSTRYKWRAILIEDMRLQRRHNEHVVSGAQFHELTIVLFAFRISVIDTAAQLVERLIEVVRLALHVEGVTKYLLYLTQVLKGVRLRVDIRFHGSEAKLWARLDEKKEEQTIHVAQALHGKLPGVYRVIREGASLVVDPIVDDLVSQKLYTLSQRVFQTVRDFGGIVSRPLVHAVQQEVPVVRADTLLAEQGCDGAQRRILLAGKDRLEVEEHATLLAPFVAVEQRHLSHAHEHHEARRLCRVEEQAPGQGLVVDGFKGYGKRIGVEDASAQDVGFIVLAI